MADKSNDQLTIQLTANHVKALENQGMMVSNKNGRDLVNFDDVKKPFVQSIYTFTIPIEVLPSNATTFGDLLKFCATGNSSTKKSGFFTCDDEVQNTNKVVVARLLTLLSAVLCDDTIGSKPHLDYYAETMKNTLEQQNQVSKPAENTNTENSKNKGKAQKSKTTANTGKNDGKDDDDNTNKNGSKSSSSESSTSSESGDSESDSDDSEESAKEKEQPVSNKEQAKPAEKTTSITRKRVKTFEDDNYDKMLQDKAAFAMKKDSRGISSAPQYLFFVYNGVKYPKYRIFIEELEGHKSMPEEHVPVTNRVKLPKSSNRYKELFQSAVEKQAEEPRIGNGFLVGLRVWIFILDPGILLNERIKYFIKEQDKRNMNPNIIPHENPLYVGPLQDITNESFLQTHVLFPYVSYGSYFRHVSNDPVVKSTTKSRQDGTFSIGLQQNNDKSEAQKQIDKDIEKIVFVNQRRKLDNPYQLKEDRDPRQVGRNVSPTQYTREEYGKGISSKFLPGLSNSAFTTNMANVCDVQRDPSSYYKIGAKTTTKTQTTKNQTQYSVGTVDEVVPISTPVAGDDMDVDKVENQLADNDDDADVDPASSVSLSTNVHKNKKSDALDIRFVGKEEEQIFKLSNRDDESSEVEEDSLEHITKPENIRVVKKVESNSYLLSNKKRVYGSSNADELEEKAKQIYETMTSVAPSSFSGFPCAHLVTEFKCTYFGASFVNAPLPHIARRVEDEPIKKIFALSMQQKQRKKQFIKTAVFSQNDGSTYSKDTESALMRATSNSDEVAESSSSSSSQTGAGKNQSYGLLAFCNNIHRHKVETTRVIKIDPNAFDKNTMSTSQMTQNLVEAVKKMNENEMRNFNHEVMQLYVTCSQINVQTSKEIDIHIRGGTDVALTEISRNQLTASELEYFAKVNDLVMLRLRFCAEASSIGAQYPKSNRMYRRAMRELRKRQTNDYVHVLQHSSKLPSSLKMAMRWFSKMVSKKKQFATIPLVYKQFGMFGNYFQFVRGVLSEVMLGRNNVELFFMMYFVYLTSLCYTYHLRPHFLASGPPTSSKSFNKDCVSQLAVPGTFVNTSHSTEMHLLSSEHYYYLTHAYDEAPVLFAAHKGKGSSQNSDAGGGGSRLMKEFTSSSKATIRTFYFERENGKGRPVRKVDEIMTALQITLICLCNLETLAPDSPLMQRFLFFVQPKKLGDTHYVANKEEKQTTRTRESLSVVGASANDMDIQDMEYDGTNVFSTPTDLKKLAFVQKDYQEPDDDDLKQTCQLFSFYILLLETMITACVVEDVSVDIAERFLPEIFDTYTSSTGDKDASPRIMMQSALIARSLCVSEVVMTVLFNNILYPDLKQERTVVLGNGTNIEPVELFEQATQLNISKLRRYCRRHAYVTAEHVATTATMMEHFISNPYCFPIITAAVGLTQWPHSITTNSFRNSGKTEDSIYFSKIITNGIHGPTPLVVDARYVCLSDDNFPMILRSIANSMKDQISQNDVNRTIGAQSRIYFNARACLIINRDWRLLRNGEVFGNSGVDTNPQQSASSNFFKPKKATDNTNNKAPVKAHRRASDAEKILQGDDKQKNNMQMDVDTANSNLVPDVEDEQSTKEKQAALEVWNKKCEAEGRLFLLDKDENPVYQPDTVHQMQIWLAKKYGTFDEMRTKISDQKERDLLGIHDYKVLKNGNEIWMSFSDKVIKSERVPVVRYEVDHMQSKKRISFLIEYAESGHKRNMKSAIQSTFASNSIPEEGTIFQSIKPFIGKNIYEGRFETSSYLTDVVQIPRIDDKNLYCLNPITTKSSGRKLIDCKSLSLGGVYGENSHFAKSERLFAKISKKISEMDGIEPLEALENKLELSNDDGKDDEDDIIDSESDSDDDEDACYKDVVEKTKTKINPYIQDQDIREKIRASSGISFKDVPLNEYAQIRHWFRIGINPSKQIALRLPSDDGVPKLTTVPKYMFYSTEFITKLIYMMTGQLAKDPETAKGVCETYSQLWLEECISNDARKRRCEKSCVPISDVFSSVYGTHTGNVAPLATDSTENQPRSVMIKDRNGNNSVMATVVPMTFKGVSDLTKAVFGSAVDYKKPIVGVNTTLSVRNMITKSTQIEKTVPDKPPVYDAMQLPLPTRLEQNDETFKTPIKSKTDKTNFVGYDRTPKVTPSNSSSNHSSPASFKTPSKLDGNINPFSGGTPILQQSMPIIQPQLSKQYSKRKNEDTVAEPPNKRAKVTKETQITDNNLFGTIDTPNHDAYLSKALNT